MFINDDIWCRDGFAESSMGASGGLGERCTVVSMLLEWQREEETSVGIAGTDASALLSIRAFLSYVIQEDLVRSVHRFSSSSTFNVQCLQLR